jgi:hypothetical protein
MEDVKKVEGTVVFHIPNPPNSLTCVNIPPQKQKAAFLDNFHTGLIDIDILPLNVLPGVNV